MKMFDSMTIVLHKDGTISIYDNAVEADLSSYNLTEARAKEFYAELRRGIDGEENIRKLFESYCNNTTAPTEATDPMVAVKKGLEAMLRFFTEFNFTPSFRFVNTLMHMTSIKGMKAYINRYFSLIDSPYADEVASKVDCAELKDAFAAFKTVSPNRTVNNRLKIYYGSQGTGKTTEAMSETENRVVVCNSSMLPADLMEDFTFDDGKAAFHPSALAECMMNGTPIVLDEINLLPFDSLRFLQGIFDGKTEFLYKGQTIQIKEGFMVIGTMNLTVNGVCFGLPEPLVDRCAEIKEFEMTADKLLGAF